jgi:hypothetical protein
LVTTLKACSVGGVQKDALVLAGVGLSGTLAQYFALKYGLRARCFAPIGMGAVLQNTIGFGRIAANAGEVWNFRIPHVAADGVLGVVDAAAYVCGGIQTPGVFGRRYDAVTPQEGIREITYANANDVALHTATEQIGKNAAREASA